MLLKERSVTLADTKKFWWSSTDDVGEVGAHGRYGAQNRYATFGRIQEEMIFK